MAIITILLSLAKKITSAPSQRPLFFSRSARFGNVSQKSRKRHFNKGPDHSVLCYEYLVTLDDEVKFFWGRKFNSVTSLYFINRYASIFASVFLIVRNFTTLPPKLYIINQVCRLVIQVCVGVILAVRTYALYGRGRRMGIVLVSLFFCALAVGSWSITGKSSKSDLIFVATISGCHSALEKEEYGEIHLASAWTSLLIYDTVIFSLTLWKAVEIWKTGPSQFFRVLVRD
ncbi:hypothetical protein M0805_000190, partial [Coniferiporia weirii]